MPSIIPQVGVYNETTNAIGLGIGGGSETVTHAAPQVLNEHTIAIGLGSASSGDTITFPSNTFNEKTNATGIGIAGLYNPGGGIGTVYETTNTTCIGIAQGNERGIWNEMFDGIIGYGIAGSSDSYVQAGQPNTWYEFGVVTGLGSCAGANTQKAYGSQPPVGLGRAGGSSSIVTSDHNSAIGLGRVSSFDTRYYHEANSATGIGSASSTDYSKYRITTSSTGLGIAASVESHHSFYSSGAKGLGIAGGHISAISFAESNSAKVVGSASVRDLIIGSGTNNATGLGSASSIDKTKFKDISNATGIGIAGGSQVRAIIEITNAKGLGIAGGSAHMVIYDSPAAVGLGVAGSANQPTNALGIIPAIRYHAKATLGVTQVIEGMPDEETLQTLPVPFFVILASKPSRIDLAVQDQAFTISFDVIYACESLANTDNNVTLRSALRPLEQALIQDYRLAGNTGVNSCYNLDIDSTPFDTVNEYAKAFFRQGQEVTVAVSSFTVSYVEFNQGQ